MRGDKCCRCQCFGIGGAFAIDGASAPPKIWRRLVLPARAVLRLETAAKPLNLLEGVLAVFSKYALKLLDNQTDFDSAISQRSMMKTAGRSLTLYWSAL